MKKILMVDDVATNLICASEVLRSDYDVSTAKSGRQALLMLNEMVPDLIMLDINMPQMDGFEVFSRLKENPEWGDIPVIFLTAESDMVNEAKCLSMGAMDFIKKPFDPMVMKARIDKILSISEEKKQLEGAAYKDSLTDLSNRKVLENYIASHKDEKGYFLLLDLDNFKLVNDTYGHVVGDSVLVKLAGVFKDITDKNDIVLRIGGDEFAIFLPGERDREELKGFVRRLIATAEFEVSDLIADYSDFKVSVSVGIASKPGDANDFEDLYSDADKALYYVKQNGKRGYHFFDTMDAGGVKLSEENNLIDILQLQRLIAEADEKSGAYQVEYEGFKRIYRFVSRCMDRKKQDVQIVLFSINGEDMINLPRENDIITSLGSEVSVSLRRGDVATQCGNSQYVVILMDANEENGRKVADRIVKGFNENIKNDSLSLSYEIESVKAGNN